MSGDDTPDPAKFADGTPVDAVLAEPVAKCDRCGRSTWTPGSVDTTDPMTQPDGNPCGGMFRATEQYPAAPSGGSQPEVLEAVTVAPCCVCGRDIPMRISEYKEMVGLGAPVMHAECAGHTDTTPVLRTYKASVQVYEMHDDGTMEMVAATSVKAQAHTLHAAFNGPLSAELQIKWLAMADKSTLADLPTPD